MDKPYVYGSLERFYKAKGQNCRGTFPLMSYLALRSNIPSSATHPCRCSSACFPFPLLLSASLQQEQEIGWKLAPPSPPSVASHETMTDERTCRRLSVSWVWTINAAGLYKWWNHHRQWSRQIEREQIKTGTDMILECEIETGACRPVMKVTATVFRLMLFSCARFSWTC